MDLLNKYKFDPAVVGHAAYGNLHFSLVVNLSVDEDKQRYASFMDEMTSMVVDKYDGSLKGRTRYGNQHGALRSKRVGRKGLRSDAAHQKALRSPVSVGSERFAFGRSSDSPQEVEIYSADRERLRGFTLH